MRLHPARHWRRLVSAAPLLMFAGWAALVPSQLGIAGPAPDAAPPSRKANRLINETSPYLLEHAYNPVDWYPWGEEAFARARRENKPIFLSVGYSTCHWCHVMARESFENEAIARLMNESFVCIKVDREERPDLDGVYLAFVETTTGGGGWPMTVFLTPDLKPFFGGGYLPPEDRGGRPGLISILKKISGEWRADPSAIAAHSARIVAELRRQAQTSASAGLDRAGAIDAAYREIEGSYDSKSGGFGGAPKFPRPAVLSFLFEVYAADPASARGRRALEMALVTLRRISKGGIHDRIGGGFHRYCVDGAWRVPHFEKMLYDQALLADSYLTAYQITREDVFADTARGILNYVERDLAAPRGGFFSAEDADSAVSKGSTKHGEGAFYTWTEAEIEAALGKDRARLFDTCFGVEPDGNVRDDPQGEFSGRNILIRQHSSAEAARMSGLGEADVSRALGEDFGLLREARNARPRPHLDDKVLTSWNGLMISAFSRGYQVLNEPAYLDSARRAAAFIEGTLWRGGDGLLLRSYCGGQASIDGFGDDYAFLIQGLLDLYEGSYDIHWLEWSRQLQAKQDELFWDPSRGGYFGTTGKDSHVLVRMKESFDGATPSANSVSALNLLRLGSMFDDKPAWARGEETIQAFAGRIERGPSNYPQMLVGVDWLLQSPKQIVIDGLRDAPATRALLTEMNRHFIPRKVVILADGGTGQRYFDQQLEFFRSLPSEAPEEAKAYVCQDYACRLPTGDVATFSELLSNSNPAK
jgi:uncharacterized protein YyaL (SSP411 family)